MQKITEIKESYTVKRREKVNGEYVMVDKTLVRFRDVNYVEGWPRFGHFLLDRVFLYIFTIIFGVMLGVILLLTDSAYILSEPWFGVVDTLLSWLVIQPLYYFVFEFSMQSSPAKLILGRIVVDEYGNKPTASQILARSFSRCVPFEYFSCLGTTGWHDDWSNTFVIRKKDLEELRMIQKINNIQNQPITEPQPTQ